MCLVRKKDKCPNPKIVHTKVGVPDAEGRSCSCPSFICEQGMIEDYYRSTEIMNNRIYCSLPSDNSLVFMGVFFFVFRAQHAW